MSHIGKRRLARLMLRIFVLAVLAFFSSRVLARPGGGSSFKGGSSSSSRGSSSSSSSSRSGGGSFGGGGYSPGYSSGYSSGGSSGSLSGLAVLIFFAIIIVIIWFVVMKVRGSQGWTTMGSFQEGGPMRPVAWNEGNQFEDGPSPRRQLEKLQNSDPNFSLVLFDDFLVALYTEVQMARGANAIAKLSPYLSPAAQQVLSTPPGGEIANVIVGALAIESVSGLGPQDTHVRVVVSFESNYAVQTPQGERGLYVAETWHFVRRRDARSRTPDKTRTFGCPSCGASLDMVVGGTCRYCHKNVSNADFDWVVEQVSVDSTEPRGPMLTSNVDEEGTDFPSIVAPDAPQRLAGITQQDPNVHWASISARVGHIFGEFQGAWANRDLATMRPYLSDALFSVQTYWVEEYKRQRLRNVTENARITNMQLANVASDAFYDSITVRLWASSLDYTVSDDGNKVVSGNRSRERAYTEYWTIIRGRGVKGPPRTDKVCPKCGAPLDVSMAGACKYCSTKVTSGGFDWVLSRIEQDEGYRG